MVVSSQWYEPFLVRFFTSPRQMPPDEMICHISWKKARGW